MTGHELTIVGSLVQSQGFCACGWTSASCGSPTGINVEHFKHLAEVEIAAEKVSRWPPPCCTLCGCYVALPEVHGEHCAGRISTELRRRTAGDGP